jgi:hypothetical protein
MPDIFWEGTRLRLKGTDTLATSLGPVMRSGEYDGYIYVEMDSGEGDPDVGAPAEMFERI